MLFVGSGIVCPKNSNLERPRTTPPLPEESQLDQRECTIEQNRESISDALELVFHDCVHSKVICVLVQLIHHKWVLQGNEGRQDVSHVSYKFIIFIITVDFDIQ